MCLCFSPSSVEKLVEGEGGGLYPGGHPPGYPVPCSGSPGAGGTWSSSVPAQPAPHPAYISGQQQPGAGGPGQPSPVPGAGAGGGQGGGGQGGAAPLPSPLYPWMRSQFGNGNYDHDTIYTNCLLSSKVIINFDDEYCFREEERTSDLHQIPNTRTRERVSLQPLSHSQAEDRDSSRPVSYRETDQDLVPEQKNEMEEGEQIKVGWSRPG